jgi:hypothetical protein
MLHHEKPHVMGSISLHCVDLDDPWQLQALHAHEAIGECLDRTGVSRQPGMKDLEGTDAAGVDIPCKKNPPGVPSPKERFEKVAFSK